MEHGDPDLPQSLRDDLSALHRTDVHVPVGTDQRITNRARAHFAKRSRARWIRWTGAAAAVAAVIVISIVLVRDTEQRQQVATAAIVGDTNGDGLVDIRDALMLARKVEAGSVEVTPREDLNNDRSIDRKDVDAVAMLAVRLEPEAVR